MLKYWDIKILGCSDIGMFRYWDAQNVKGRLCEKILVPVWGQVQICTNRFFRRDNLAISAQTRWFLRFPAPLIAGDFASIKPWSDKIPVAMLEKLRKCSYRLLRKYPVICSLPRNREGIGYQTISSGRYSAVYVPEQIRSKIENASGRQWIKNHPAVLFIVLHT